MNWKIIDCFIYTHTKTFLVQSSSEKLQNRQIHFDFFIGSEEREI